MLEEFMKSKEINILMFINARPKISINILIIYMTEMCIKNIYLFCYREQTISNFNPRSDKIPCRDLNYERNFKTQKARY